MKRLLACKVIVCLAFLSCRDGGKTKVSGLTDLKRGDVVSCGPADGKLFGNVSFLASMPAALQSDFNMGVALLHSFEYDEAEKVFAKIIDQSPDCAMAYWGVAMSNFHPLWAPPNDAELRKGARAVEIARTMKPSKRESDYIEAVGKFYENTDELGHLARVKNFEKAMENVYSSYKDDLEAAVFYALALNASADPADKTYANQKKAIAILTPVFEKQPMHPGPAHYIIHNCDYPELASLALNAARKYATIAPASAHAQHMPSHIFTRLGLWEECIQSNIVAASSAQCYAEQAKLPGHWDEELHANDYLMYGYLQRGADKKAKALADYVGSIKTVTPVNFKVAYAFASIPARYVLEKKMWKEAADLGTYPADLPWDKFPWQKSIIHFTRLLGAVNTGQPDKAKNELASLQAALAVLQKQKDKAKEAGQVAIQIKTGEAWIAWKEGNKVQALTWMREAADMEDATEKHPVTPGEVLPARELLGEMLLQMNDPAGALEAFEMSLKNHANRFNSLYGAGRSAKMTGNTEKAAGYFKQLLSVVDAKECDRKELDEAGSFR